MSIVSNNIKYLRRLNGLTQEQFARKIAIKRSLLGAYEEARANPNLTNLKNMAAAFGITVDNLLKNDLRKIRETPDLSLPMSSTRPMTVSHSGNIPTPARPATFTEPQPLAKIIEKYQQPEPEIRTVARPVTLKPVDGSAYTPPPTPQEPFYTHPIQSGGYQPPVVPVQPVQPMQYNQADSMQPPVFNNAFQPLAPEVPANNYPVVQWVPRIRNQEYLSQFQNPGFLASLPSFQLPNLPSGYFRAFESGDDFMYPGSLLVGSFIRNWYDIKDGNQYVFVLRSQGIVVRTAYNQVRTSGFLQLVSPTGNTAPSAVNLNDVLEVWEIKAFVSNQLPTPMPSLEKISRLVRELQDELDQLLPEE